MIQIQYYLLIKVESFIPIGPGLIIKYNNQSILLLQDDNFQIYELLLPNNILRLYYYIFKGKSNLLIKDGLYNIPKELRDRNSFAIITVISR